MEQLFFLLVAHNRDMNFGMPQVTGYFDVGDGHMLDPRISQFDQDHMLTTSRMASATFNTLLELMKSTVSLQHKDGRNIRDQLKNLGGQVSSIFNHSNSPPINVIL